MLVANLARVEVEEWVDSLSALCLVLTLAVAPLVQVRALGNIVSRRRSKRMWLRTNRSLDSRKYIRLERCMLLDKSCTSLLDCRGFRI